ncbi:MAG: hypothetical protein M3R38_21880, partial [Actinomycetota bacterium]|nr:hypothetical protein [Actinomycetota bacterium]
MREVGAASAVGPLLERLEEGAGVLGRGARVEVLGGDLLPAGGLLGGVDHGARGGTSVTPCSPGLLDVSRDGGGQPRVY